MNNLMYRYIEAQERLFKRRIFIPEKYEEKFLNLEIELMKCRIKLEEYAYIVTVHWKEFCIGKGLDHVPINMFLGQASRRAFNSYLKMRSVRIPSKNQLKLDKALLVEEQFLLNFIGTSLPENELLSGFTQKSLSKFNGSGEAWLGLSVEERDKLKRELIIRYSKLYKTPFTSYEDIRNAAAI